MRSLVRRSWLAAIVVIAGAGLVATVATTASADKKTKSVQTEAKWIAFDGAAKTVKAKVKKAGRGNQDKAVKPGSTVAWSVIPEGSELTRTTVAINGRKGELADIPEGKTVNIYWVPDETKSEGRLARKIDVVLSEEELLDRWEEAD